MYRMLAPPPLAKCRAGLRHGFSEEKLWKREQNKPDAEREARRSEHSASGIHSSWTALGRDGAWEVRWWRWLFLTVLEKPYNDAMWSQVHSHFMSTIEWPQNRSRYLVNKNE